MIEDLYSRRSNLVIGFHGCDQTVVDAVVNGKQDLKMSTNDYDWLGNGIYFWENNASRALQYAIEKSTRLGSRIDEPAVIGAVLDLGYCMDLTDSLFLAELKNAYSVLQERSSLLPTNIDVHSSKDKLLRKLDCLVIETAHSLNEIAGNRRFDSVKGVFWEGDLLYPGAGFTEKNHIQICVRNPNCIKGFFLPRQIDKQYFNP